MSNNEDSEWLRSQLQNVLSANGWTCEQWAKRAGIAPTTLTRFINKQTTHVPSTSTLLKLERAAGRPLLGATSENIFLTNLEKTKAETKQAGAYIRDLRMSTKMSQRAFATALKIKHYGFISQVESGATFLPSEYWPRVCDLCGENITRFTHKLMSHYYPEIYENLTSEEGQKYAINK